MSTAVFSSPAVRALVAAALTEDRVDNDITTLLTVETSLRGVGELLAKESLVACGLPIIETIFSVAKCRAEVVCLTPEGGDVGAGAILARISGCARDILSLERTILNFVQRLSGVASMAREYTRAAEGLKILDTRKTMPGWRELDKYATRTGGATNHRTSLADMILVKNNHIDLNGGDVNLVMDRVIKNAPTGIRIEVEVRNESELRTVLEYRPARIMLDNMNDADLERSIKLIRSKADDRIEIEASGGITKARLVKLQHLGVDCVSIGGLTTKALNKDISLRLSRDQ